MRKHVDDESEMKQGGCMWGIVHVLDYHQWQSNVKKIIHHRKPEARSHDQCEWSPETSVHERLLKEQGSPHHAAGKRSRSSKKRSLRARLKAILAEEASVEDKDSRGISTNSSLQRTYSIHHLESVDDFFGKIRKDWNHPIIFLPDRSSKSSDAAQIKAAGIGECDSHSPRDADHLNSPDVFEIFKMDKELLLKHLQDSDEGIANFSRSVFGLKSKGRFSKSRSFPVAELPEGRKVKPLKLESKQNEVWSLPRNDKIANKSGEDDGIRRIQSHRRSSSLSESVDRYARLFENGFGKDVKLSSSRSLKLASEYGYAPPSFKRINSVSNADSYYSDVNFEALRENLSGANVVVVAEDSNAALQNNEVEEEEAAGLAPSDDEETVPLNADMEIKEDDYDIKEIQDEGLVSDSNIFLQEKESPVVELHAPKGMEHESKIHKLDSSIDIDDYETKKNLDFDYVRHLLDRSQIAREGPEMTWHATDQLLSPQLLEEVEAGWPHEELELDGWPDFRGCWHHQMLFDAVNEALLEVYDISLPYYPKALSSSCNVPPFPVGDRVVEEVCTSIGTLLDVKPEEQQAETLDCIVARDLAHDRSWMNLQLESENVVLDLEDMIFHQLLQEVMFS